MRFEAPADRRSKGCQHRRHTPLIRPPLGCTAAAAEGAKEAAKVLGTARRLTPLMTSDGLPHCMQVLDTAPTLKPPIATDGLPHCMQVLDTALAHTELVLVSGNTADAAADAAAEAAGGVPVKGWKAAVDAAGGGKSGGGGWKAALLTAAAASKAEGAALAPFEDETAEIDELHRIAAALSDGR